MLFEKFQRFSCDQLLKCSAVDMTVSECDGFCWSLSVSLSCTTSTSPHPQKGSRCGGFSLAEEILAFCNSQTEENSRIVKLEVFVITSRNRSVAS